MDPEMERFLSADPMGYVDGPSEYAFAGNSPQDRTDPLGLFQQDFHQGLTEYLARLAGFNYREAKLIGRAAQSPDCEEDPRNPINSGLLINSSALPPFGAGAFPKTQVSNAERAEAAMRLRIWHFPLTLTSEGFRVVKQSAEASEIYRRGIQEGNLWAFGSGLHVLEDSFSHSGKGSREFFDPVRAMYAQYGYPDERGGLFDASTDEPDKYPLLAIEAAAATFAALLEFRSQNDPSFDFEEFAARWEDYSRAPILQFINSAREGRLEWLGDAHFYLDPE